MRVSIETAADLCGISARLLRYRINKHGVLRLLGGPGPAALDLDDVLFYRTVMPPLQKHRKLRGIDNLGASLIARTGQVPRMPGSRTGSLGSRPAAGSTNST